MNDPVSNFDNINPMNDRLSKFVRALLLLKPYLRTMSSPGILDTLGGGAEATPSMGSGNPAAASGAEDDRVRCLPSPAVEVSDKTARAGEIMQRMQVDREVRLAQVNADSEVRLAKVKADADVAVAWLKAEAEARMAQAKVEGDVRMAQAKVEGDLRMAGVQATAEYNKGLSALMLACATRDLVPHASPSIGSEIKPMASDARSRDDNRAIELDTPPQR